MAKLIELKIDVTKVNKSKLYVGTKGTYLTLTVALNDEEDQYGNNVSCWEAQTKEERQIGEDKNYLGNGKVFWSNESQIQQAKNTIDNQLPPDEDNLPF